MERLISIRVNPDTPSQSSLCFLYDGERLIAEYVLEAPINGNLAPRYIHGAGVDDPAVCIGMNGSTQCAPTSGAGVRQPTFLIPDERGSIIAYIQDNGTVDQKNRYGAFGRRDADFGGVYDCTGQRTTRAYFLNA